MQNIKISGIKIEAIYSAIPTNVLDNINECKSLFNDAVENVIKGTGINKRCVADENTTALDLCTFAAKKLIQENNIDPNDIGAIIFVTFTPDFIMPCNAIKVQDLLGLNNDVIAFDINLACSGYCYGLYQSGLICKSINKKVLLLDGDVQTSFTSKKDKSTVPVLADAGSATLLTISDENDEWIFTFFSDGSRNKSLFIPSGGARNRTNIEDLKYVSIEDGSMIRNIDIHMNGYDIFKFVASDASKLISEFCTINNITNNNIDDFVPHQANIYMITLLTRKLKISSDKLRISGDIFGNSASATVPVTISSRCNVFLNDYKYLLLSGFGGGLSISVGYIKIDKTIKLKQINYSMEE